MPQTGFTAGDWCWCARQGAPCRVIDRLDAWGQLSYRVWLPNKDAVIRAGESELTPLSSVVPTVEHVLHATAAAKLQDALEENLLLAPIQSSVVPLPHQLYALNRAMSRHRIRYLFADEVGLGKTIEAGLVLRELKLRGRIDRVLVVAPKGLIRQWQAEMRLHFGETLHHVDTADLASFRQWRTDEDNLWRVHDQVICSLDSVKPIEGRRGWSTEQVAAHNRERFEDLVAAGWDLVIIDEAHRLGGSTDLVARYKLGAALAEASPYLLLLSATPHQGKTDQFMRLMQLLDKEAFPDEASITRDRVQPFVVRTEKRASINAEGLALFKPRLTRLQAVAWQHRHGAQRQLYEAVTDYVRHGYNQAMAAKQRHVAFLMILMQRLVTSSTAAIRVTLEKRLMVLEAPPPQTELFNAVDPADWVELDGQTQADVAFDVAGWVLEKGEVETLLTLARETEAAGSDAKAEALLELVYKLQQEENDPALKVLVFTEFVATQAMLAGFLESRGFPVVTINGGMDMESRSRSQRTFAAEARILVSSDAGGEGLNLQFCHVIVNFDCPWNPMKIEQRIGRVDRIGQRHVVRAFNFVLEDTVEHRVREVLEQKLAVIAEEFGVDKTADVMDSVDVDPVFDALFVRGLQDPSSIEAACDAVVDVVREQVSDAKKNADLISDGHDLDASSARQWRDHPAQFWLERAIVNGLREKGGEATKTDAAWCVRWGDGSESLQACFDARLAEENPALEWITLEDPRARAVIDRLPHCVAGQPMPTVQMTGLPDTVRGVWSLWQISLAADGSSRKRFLPVFVNEQGRAFVPTARRVWDLLLTEVVRIGPPAEGDGSVPAYEASIDAARTQGERIFRELMTEHKQRLKDERERAQYAFEARRQAIGRLGLPAVREHRLKRLTGELAARLAALDQAETAVPDLHAVLLVRIAPVMEVLKAAA
jgi:superfamily II DNA or RNA helicase